MADNTNDEAAKQKAADDAKAKLAADKAEAEAKEAEAKAAKQKAADDARAAKALGEDALDELLESARMAGASEKSLAELRTALESSSVDDVPKFEAQIEALRKKNRKPHHVVSQGAVMFNGDRYEHEDPILLTEAEALDLGPEVVAPGTAAPKPREISKRKAGKYTVAGPGTVYKDGRHRQAGDELELDEADARSLGEAVVEA